MTPVLHPHTNTSPALGNQQVPILILGHIAKSASRAFPFPVLFALDAQLFERGLEVLREGYLVGRLFVPRVYSQPTGGLPGGEIRRLCSGTGGGGGRATRKSRSRHPSRRC